LDLFWPVSGAAIAFARAAPEMVGSCSSDLSGRVGLVSSLLLQFPAIVTFHGNCVDMSFCLFVVPLLGMGLPDFPFATDLATKWPINVEVRKRSVGIDVVELVVIC
jgi:hypothetical protein